MPELIVLIDETCSGLSDLDLLERVASKVKRYELVKFRGKAYRRITQKRSKECEYPYRFVCYSDDIYAGNNLSKDEDGEYVNALCKYKAVVSEEVMCSD